MKIKFLHIADTHLGVENYGRLDSRTGLHTRLQDFVNSLKFAFKEGHREEVDLVIFTGDAYRSYDPTPTHQREFASLIQMLSTVKIPIVMITGNHDSPVAFGKASSLDIFGTLATEGVHVVSRDQLLIVQTKSGPLQVACLPWLHRSHLVTGTPYQNLSQEEIVEQLQDLGTQIIERLANQIDPKTPAILAAHVAASEATLSGSEQTAIIGRDPVFLTSILANPAFDYVALGHIHKFQDLNPSGVPPVVYPGSIERIDFGEENEAKGICIVTIQDPDDKPKRKTINPAGTAVNSTKTNKNRPSRKVSYRFIQTPSRPFKTLNISIEKGSDPTTTIIEKIKHYTLTNAVVRIIYEVEEGESDTIDLKAVNRALENSFLVTSIAPKPKAHFHKRRANISEHMVLKEALHAYIQNHVELETLEEDLQITAASLEAELLEKKP